MFQSEAHTIDETIAILEKGPRVSAANLLIADGKRTRFENFSRRSQAI